MFEELVLSREGAAHVACPKCGQRKVDRQISVFAAHAAGTERPAPACQGCDRSAGTCPLASLKAKG